MPRKPPAAACRYMSRTTRTCRSSWRPSRALKPDLFLAVGYMFRLKAEILAVPRLVSANVHASLLPAYRGRSPVFWALRHGEPYSGLSIHSMDQELDRGNLLYQVRVRTRKNDTVASLYDRIIAKGLKLVPKLIADAERGRLPRIATPESAGSYFSAAKEADFRLDWSRGTEELRRWIVITPGQCFTDVRGQRVFFLDAKIAANPKKAVAGDVAHNRLDRLARSPRATAHCESA